MPPKVPPRGTLGGPPQKKKSNDDFQRPHDIAEKLLNSAPGLEVTLRATKCNGKTWTQVLGVLGKKRRHDIALQILDHLHTTGQEVNEYHCSAAIVACEKSGRCAEALDLLAALEKGKFGVAPNTFCYSAAIGACEKTGAWEAAIDLLNKMNANPQGAQPNHFCYSAAIRACASGRQTDRALQLLKEMKSRGVAPNLHTFTAAITACARTKRLEDAEALLVDCRNMGLFPDVIVYSALISVCEVCSHWQRALELLKIMRKEGVEPNGVSYSTALSACEGHGRWEEALQLIAEMKRHNIPPDVVAFSAALGACEAANRKKEAKTLILGLGQLLPNAKTPREAFLGLVAFAKLGAHVGGGAGSGDEVQGAEAGVGGRGEQDKEPAKKKRRVSKDSNDFGVDKQVLQGTVSKAVEALADLSPRDFGSLLWSIARLEIPCSSDLLAKFEEQYQAIQNNLPWQSVGLLDYARRQMASATGHKLPFDSTFDLVGNRVVQEAFNESERENHLPTALLLTLEEFKGPTVSDEEMLVVDDWQLAQSLKKLGRKVKSWSRMSGGRHLSSATPRLEGRCGGAVVRLTGVQSNAGGAGLRYPLALVAASVDAGKPVWILGTEEEGIKDVQAASQNLFRDFKEAARQGTARIFICLRSKAKAPDPSTFQNEVTLKLADIGMANVEHWRVWPGLFSGGGLDVMTTFLLKKMLKLTIAEGAEVIDFCSGSGTIAEVVRQMQPKAVLHLADADALAIDAAKNNLPFAKENCYLGDGWHPVPEGLTFDLIVSNPPVHRRRCDDFRVVEALVEGSVERLRPHGRLWIVAQVHVPVGPILQRSGFAVRPVSDGRFTVWKARRRTPAV